MPAVILVLSVLLCILALTLSLQIGVTRSTGRKSFLHTLGSPLRPYYPPLSFSFGSDFERNEPNSQSQDKQNHQKQQQEQDQVKANKQEISDSMKERLRSEIRSQGGDPNYSAGPILGNPILLISLVIAVLVIAGGKDILY